MTAVEASFLFDWNSYISERLLTLKSNPSKAGEKAWTVDRFEDGSINETVRVSFMGRGYESLGVSESNKNAEKQIYDLSGYETVILKYAPPFVARAGPQLPFAQQRQAVEATALEALSGSITRTEASCSSEKEASRLSDSLFLRPNAREHLLGDPEIGIRVPQYLFHDKKAHVLAMTDLGSQIRTLDSILLWPGETELRSDSLSWPQPLHHELAHAGNRLGRFLARLHDSNMQPSDALDKRLQNPDVAIMLTDGMVKPVVDVLRAFKIPNYEKLGGIVTADLKEQTGSSMNATNASADLAGCAKGFALGDFWPGNVMLGPSRSARSENREEDVSSEAVEVAILDLEFAKVGPGGIGLSTDMGIFISHLIGMGMLEDAVAAHKPCTVKSLVDAFLPAFIDGYRQENIALDVPWLLDEVRAATIAKDGTARGLAVLRSAFIACGREIVFNVLRRNWPCTCCKTATPGQGGRGFDPVGRARRNCFILISMMDLGARYISLAGEDIAEFTRPENWQLVMEERILRRLIMV